jgi:hypothetical protein
MAGGGMADAGGPYRGPIAGRAGRGMGGQSTPRAGGSCSFDRSASFLRLRATAGLSDAAWLRTGEPDGSPAVPCLGFIVYPLSFEPNNS